MKNSIVLISISLILCACKLASSISNQRISVKSASYKFNPDSMIFVPVDIDTATAIPFLFDTGASISFVKNDSIISGRAKSNTIKFGHITTADGIKQPNLLMVTRIRTPWFDSDNKIMGLNPSKPSFCPQKSTLYGIIGADAFLESKMVLSINNSIGEITSYPQGTFDRSLLKGYQKINAKLTRKAIWIELEIAGEKAMYMMDTGNNAGIMTPYKKTHVIDSQSITILGKGFQSANEAFGSETIIAISKIKISGIECDGPVIIQKDNPMKNFGMAAIKLFDWYFDFATKEVFIRRNVLKTIEPKITKAYFTAIIDGKIEVFSKIKGYDEYTLGDQITAINNEAVTIENLCKMQDLLSFTNDWSDLSIQKTSAKSTIDK